MNNRIPDRGKKNHDPVKCRLWALGGGSNWLEKQSGSHSPDRAIFHKPREEGSSDS